MASLTINDLKTELIAHGVELPPSTAKKEEYVALHEKNIPAGEKGTIDFSSDEEEVSIPAGGKVSTKKMSRKSGVSTKKLSRKSEALNVANGNSENSSQVENEAILTEENSLIVGEFDVETLSDEQLTSKLKDFNVTVGPIVGKC